MAAKLRFPVIKIRVSPLNTIGLDSDEGSLIVGGHFTRRFEAEVACGYHGDRGEE